MTMRTLIDANGMARLGCGGCAGCSDCCRNMGDSIVLDPYDIYLLQTATGQNFSQLMQEKIGLHVEDGLILPSLAMQEDTGACGFLNGDGRCGIHSHRPGLCRLFPLGRNYDENGLRYFLLEDACKVGNRAKIKVKKWLDIADFSAYESFLTEWHNLRKDLKNRIAGQKSDRYTQEVNVVFLKIFYQTPYDTQRDFYVQFDLRLKNEQFVRILAGENGGLSPRQDAGMPDE